MSIISKNNSFNISGLSAEEQTSLIHSPLFRGLATGLQEVLISGGNVRSLQKGEFLFMAGDEINTIYYVLSGKLHEYYTTEAGEICMRRIIVPENYISLHMIFNRDQVYSYTCEAVNRSVCFAWDAGKYLKILKTDPEFGFQVSMVLSSYFETTCRLNCLCRKTQAVSRVAGYLLRQCSPLYPNSFFYCANNKLSPEVNIRPLGLSANDICLARETFSRAITALQEKDIIRMKGGIVEILDLEALKKVSGTE